MLSRISGIVARRMQVSSNKLAMPFLSVRSFSDNLSIPSDAEQQGGRRKEELDAEAAGGVAFDHRHPLVPDTDAGTKENPIMVPSAMHSRTIGYENPATHQLLWFDLAEGPLHFIPDINLYFKLKKID